MPFLPPLFEAVSLNDPLTYFAVFLAGSLLMLWRLEAMLDSGLEGTALGTVLLPYCSGLGNLIFVAIMIRQRGDPREVVTNCLVNNVTNLTLLLGLPALLWGLQVLPRKAAGSMKGRKSGGRSGKGADAASQLNRLSLLLTLAAVVFFTGAVWWLARDGRLDATDGFVLIGLFLFWQCVQVFDVLKHNVRQRVSFGLGFYLDAAVVLGCAYFLYESIDWLVGWISAQRSGFISAENLGWVTGWLMVLPNAILALYWGWRRRADVVYSSQVGDGHICIPLCLGVYAVFQPLPMSGFSNEALLLLLSATALHGLFLLVRGGLPRWAGGILCAGYGWFVWTGLLA